MAITVKHNKVSTIPDTDDTSLVRPSDWNADHTLVGTIDVANGGTGASTLTGYVKGNGTSAMTAVATVPSTDITGLGTMSTQNANAVAITGGTINGTTIGATSASSVNATTITGQTGVLRGTGQNLLTFSEQFQNAVWNATGCTIVANDVIAPDGNLTGDRTVEGTGSVDPRLPVTVTLVSGTIYALSIYAKEVPTSAKRYLNITWNSGFASQLGGVFDLGAGTAVNVNATSSSITAVGNGWYRCTVITTTTTSTSASFRFRFTNTNSTSNITAPTAFTGDGASGLYIWGAQLEIASSVGTYIPTTTTAVYGTPTLSFSGVSEIGLLSTGALYLQPAGTGALQAQATTSTTAGGNARGANAVDWQTARGAASQVASGGNSFVGSGNANTAGAFGSAIVGGVGNTTSNAYAFVGAGTGNNANLYSSIVGGQGNIATGFFNFIGGGFTNTGTSTSAVTTQSGTMNATTAVTLSGSNANIRVGQYITGTSIAADTYVAAISGTSLTLSQAASGSSTSTLSFFTPHGVVVGGGNNQATGSYSFIGGGGDAGTAAQRNVASGDWSVVCGGKANTASGLASFIGGGGTFAGGSNPNTASGAASFVGGGFLNNATNFASMVIGGNGNTSNGNYSCVTGVTGSTRAINNSFVISSNAISVTGDSQTAILVVRTQTTNATATALTSDGSAATTNNQVILPNNSAYFFTGEVVSGVTGGGNTKGWTIEGVIKRGANAASTALVGTPTVTSMYADVGAATWAIAVTADTTNGGLRVTFTGQAATTIRTVCRISSVEMTY